MKLTSIEIHPANSDNRVALSFRDPGTVNPYNVKSITGLDADTITARPYRGTGLYYNMSLENRQIVARIGLNPRFSEYKTYSELRDNLYRLISSSRTGKLQLRFKNSADTVAQIYGHVAKFESPLFEKNQEVVLTIQCDEPMLKAPNPVVILRDADTETSEFIIVEDNKSTAPHGFDAEIKIKADASVLGISDELATWAFAIYPPGGFLAGDIVSFSSEYNEKYLWLNRGGVYTHLGDKIYPGSTWPIIFPGFNKLVLSSSAAVQWQKIEYYPTYWGV